MMLEDVYNIVIMDQKVIIIFLKFTLPIFIRFVKILSFFISYPDIYDQRYLQFKKAKQKI